MCIKYGNIYSKIIIILFNERDSHLLLLPCVCSLTETLCISFVFLCGSLLFSNLQNPENNSIQNVSLLFIFSSNPNYLNFFFFFFRFGLFFICCWRQWLMTIVGVSGSNSLEYNNCIFGVRNCFRDWVFVG